MCYLFVYFVIYYNFVLFSCVVHHMKIIFKAYYLASGSCWGSVGMSVFPCIFHHTMFSQRAHMSMSFKFIYISFIHFHRNTALISILLIYASALQSK